MNICSTICLVLSIKRYSFGFVLIPSETADELDGLELCNGSEG